MVMRKIVIHNSSGLHIRPAGKLAKAAEQCDSRVEFLIGDSIVNCKSLLNIISCAIHCGDEIVLCCTGKSEEKDIEYMVHVIENELE